jgi:small subunit ribosomal protein S1
MAEKELINEETVNQTNLQEEYMNSMNELQEGKIIDGKVIQVTADTVFIDVNYKSEGKVPLNEFDEIPKIGDDVKVVLVRKEDRYGNIVVSKKQYDEKKILNDVKEAEKDGSAIKGKITKVVKGGFEVSIGPSLKGFLPISKADVVKIEDPAPYVGTTSMFFIEHSGNDKKMNLVLNRRKYLSEELTKKKEKFYSEVQEGDTVEGTVKTIATFGAFIDLGGFDGLLHINDMSWGHVTKPKEYVKKGQSIKLKVINLDKENNKINLSLKHFTDNPWDTFEDRYHVNDIVTGKVTKLTDFGAFIELEEGIEGMAHVSEFSWVKKVNNPKDMFKVGDEVKCMILGYNLGEGKISLGIKQVEDNPWDTIDQKYPVGTILERNIVKITATGAFIQLEDGIDGFLHGDDISWLKKVKNINTMFKVGDTVKTVIVNCDKVQHRIKLGIKQLSENPWAVLAKTYQRGSIIEGEISSKTEFGLFVKVQDEIEGLINKSNLQEEFVENVDKELEKFNVGDKVKAMVIEINPKKQKLGLSIKEYKKSLQREEISRYMSENEEPKATLGDFLKH